MLKRLWVPAVALIVTVGTLAVWLLWGTGPGGPGPWAAARPLPSSVMTEDVDGDGEPEQIWLAPVGSTRGVTRLVVRKNGINYTSPRAFPLEKGRSYLPGVWRIDAQLKMVGVLSTTARGQNLTVFILQSGGLRPVGSFCGKIVSVEDANWDSTTDVVVFHSPEDGCPIKGQRGEKLHQGREKVEVYVFDGRAFSFSESVTGWYSQHKRPAQP